MTLGALESEGPEPQTPGPISIQEENMANQMLDRLMGLGGEDLRTWNLTKKDFGGPGAAPHYPPDLEIEPVHILIDLKIDIEEFSAEGAVTTTVAWAVDTSTLAVPVNRV